MIKKNNNEKDIVYELYNKNELNSNRLQFITETCTAYLNISSSLIKILMKDNNKELLEILFKKHLKFFDNNFIINILNYYKNQTAISDSDFFTLINNDKYKISTDVDELYRFYYSQNDLDSLGGSYYLLNACNSGNETTVKYLLKHGADINKYYSYHSTPFFNACHSGNLKLVKYLVKLGTDIHKVDINGETPLFFACEKGHQDIVKYFVEELGADINKENRHEQTPVFRACHSGNLNLVKYLVDHGADINKEDRYGDIPLYFACEEGHEDVVKYSIEKLGSDINKKNCDEQTPLFKSLDQI